MLTLEYLKAMAPHQIIGSGLAMDKIDGLYLAGTGNELRWVAVRGDIHDWAIYAHLSIYTVEWIMKHGDKVCQKENIKKLVPCTDEAFALYRR